MTPPTYGPIPGHAVFDTPPPDTQPAVLTCDQRSRVPSARKHEQLISEGKPPLSTLTSNAAAKVKTPFLSSQPRKSKKQAVVVSASDDDDEPPQAWQARNQGTKGSAPQPESPACDPTVAARSPANAPATSAPVTLDSGTAATLGQLFGIDFATMSPKEFERTIKALSDTRPQEMAASKHYAKIQGVSPSLLPALNKQGGYHREHLEAFEMPSQNSAKRSHSLQDMKVAKQARKDPQEEMDSLDLLAADPDANISDTKGCPPLPSPLFGTQLSKQHSVSSTQGATVNAPSTHPSRPQPTPSEQARKPPNLMLEASTSALLATPPILRARIC
ncbi:hypothetical protein BDV93DRAFT_508284 [Ceratobasidium sp. AG-I]|nr:hypothetical protein BDV93DRAFT_508284 [Ceratobasidium sp. AG-I]